jgi:molybdate transport system substrate-binding protein
MGIELHLSLLFGRYCTIISMKGMLMKRVIWLGLFIASMLVAGKIKIAVAANVSYTIHPLIKAFEERYPDCKVEVTLGSSGKLTAQIFHGAPYALFMSANMKYPQKLYHDSIAVTRPLVYAQGKLAYLSTKKRDFSQGINLLTSKEIEKIAVANPQTAPYGIAAAEAFKNAGIQQQLQEKFVYGESISQTLSFTLHAADIGLVAKSSLYSPKLAHFKEGVHWREVDSALYTPINQGVVILKEGASSPEVAAFYAFLFSKKAAEIFKAYGYIVP